MFLRNTPAQAESQLHSRRHWPLCECKKTVYMCFKQEGAIATLVVTASLGRSYASSIYSIFPLCLKLNALGKSTNCSVVLKFFAHTPLMI